MTTKRYTVSRACDSTGSRYATGPLTFIETDVLAEAQAEVYRRGGEVVDHVERTAWTPGLGWFDAADYLDGLTG